MSMTSATDRASITTLLDRAERDKKSEIMNFSQYIPRRAKSEANHDAVVTDHSDGVEDSAKIVLFNPSSDKDLDQSAAHQLDFELMTKVINAACAMLKDLGKRNEEITTSAEGAIASLKAQLAVEKDRSNKLQTELETARADKDRLAEESQARIKQLELENASSTEKLEEATRELASVRPWLEYLNSQIQSELQEAISQAERIISNPVSLPI
jgi:chromosome segregation ATPase